MLLSASFAKAPQNFHPDTPARTESCGTKLKNETLAKWEIQDGNNSAQKQLHCANVTDTDLETYYQYMNLGWPKDILRYYGYDGGGWLYIEEVPSIEVAVSEAKYATLNLPFAVSIPGDVKVTYINGIESQNENTVYLTEQEITGVIPANTPVILYTERGGWNSELWSETEELSQASSYNFILCCGLHLPPWESRPLACFPKNTTSSAANKQV